MLNKSDNDWRQMTGCVVLTCLIGILYANAARADTSVYRCELDHKIIFTDRPCPPGQSSTEVDVAVVNEYRSAEQAASSKSAPLVPGSGRSGATRTRSEHKRSARTEASAASAKKQCRHLSEQLAAVRAKLRGGYRPKEDRALHERQASLQQKLQARRCRT